MVTVNFDRLYKTEKESKNWIAQEKKTNRAISKRKCNEIEANRNITKHIPREFKPTKSEHIYS